MADSLAQIDNRIEIVTPENIAFQYAVAGPFTRLPAYLIDFVIRVVVVIGAIVALVFGFGVVGFHGIGLGIGFVLWFVLEWFYGGLFEAIWNGQTPGKRAMRLRVLTVEGQPIQAWQAVLRNFLRGADCLPWFMYQFGLFTTATNDRFQRLGDLAAGTMVVVEQKHRAAGVIRVDEPEVLKLAADLPPSLVINRSLSRALSAYVTRRLTFPWRRRLEIAMHLSEPLREKLDLPREINPDLLLCAVYRRAFISDRQVQPPESLPNIQVQEFSPV